METRYSREIDWRKDKYENGFERRWKWGGDGEIKWETEIGRVIQR
jgi:hypothetical protein